MPNPEMSAQIIKSAAQAGGFYDMPLYNIAEEKPCYYDLFNWGPWPGAGLRIESNFTFTLGGSLREELFDTINKKIAYLQGVFEDPSEGLGISRGENWIHFANSSNKVERCKKWINEIARYMCKDKLISSKNENSHLLNLVTGGIIRHKIEYLFPICHRVDIQPEVVRFIKNYKFN